MPHHGLAGPLYQCSTACVMLVSLVGLLGSTAALAQALAPELGNGGTMLIQRQGQQKRDLMQGQAATGLNQRQAKDLAATLPAASQPDLPLPAAPASRPQLVTEADVMLQRSQRIQRLNAAKVDPAAQP